MDTSSVIERLKVFVKQHPETTQNGFIKGLDSSTGKVVIVSNGETKYITIDELEGLYNNAQVQQPVSNQMTAPAEEIEVMQDIPQEEIEVMDEQPVATSNQIVTLKDFQNAVLSKDERSMDKILETFAIDERTSTINMNKAIKIVTDNCTNNVINCVRDNTSLSDDLSKYDVMSRPLSNLEQSMQKEELTNLIDKSFQNILVYVEAARLKNIIYTPEQIEAAKKKYATTIQDKINVLGLNQKSEEITPDNVKEQPKEMSLELQPDKNLKKAGFADILILTIIVLVYAAIIINLVTKLK